MSFKDELTAEVNSVRQKIKTEAINHFINKLKKAMKNTASKGITNGSISLRLNLDECEEDEDEDCTEDHTGDYELYRLNELLLMTKERETGAIEIYKWLIKEIDKTGVFKDIYINIVNIDEENYELKFFWYIEE
jgi:hypothetical protein